MRAYVVWVPSLPADVEETVPAAAARIGDGRASHFWDAEGLTREAYRRVMKMKKPAWDIYFVYGRDAEWKDEPPAPDYYMHQLDGLPPERELDGDKLAAELNKLLRPQA